MAGTGGARPGAGRKKGQKAASTISAEEGKALLVAMYLERCRPINEALLAKAESGDIAAIKELHDRVYNKAMQPLGGAGKDGNFVFEMIHYGENKNTNPV